MEIIHIITTVERGGAENQLLVLVGEQIKAGLDVTVVPLKGNSELDEAILSSGAKVKSLRECKNFLSQILRLRQLLPRDPHVLHAHLPQAELIARFARNPRSKFVITRHYAGPFYPNKPLWLSNALSRLASGPAATIIAISDSVKKHLLESREIKETSKIRRIYYGFDCEKFKSVSFPKPKDIDIRRNRDELIIGTIGRLSDEKDYPTLLRAIAVLASKQICVKLYIVGAGAMKTSLVKLVDDLEISNVVTWSGRILDTPSFYRQIDLFVLASKFEGFGMVLLEGMCMKVPIIAAKNSALLEVLGRNGAGVFFNTGNFQELAEKIQGIKDIDRSIMFEQQTVQLMKFSPKKMAEETIATYKS